SPHVQERAFMSLSRPPSCIWRAAAAVAVLGLLATSAFAQKKDDKKDSSQPKFTDAQRQELLPVIRTVDEVMKNGSAGVFNDPPRKHSNNAQRQHPRADAQLGGPNDFLRATTQLISAPFIASVEPPKPSPPGRGTTPAPPAPAGAPAPAAGATNPTALSAET